MFVGGRARFGFLHFYPEIFYFISSFSTFVSKFLYSGIKYILLLAESRDRMEFRGPGLTPSEHHLPRCLFGAWQMVDVGGECYIAINNSSMLKLISDE